MDLLRLYCIAPPPPPLFVRSSWSHHQNPYTKKTTPAVASSYKRTPVVVPARDRVIEFGKHKGKMLGTLPSDYLKWVSSNLRAGDFEEWAKLADQVLGDEVYKDRIEWEQAWMLLSGDDQRRRESEGVAGEIEGMGERFGWDNDDKVGWSNVNFGLLGTSHGGRIPRIGRDKPPAAASAATSRNKSGGKGSIVRERRRERMRKKREHKQLQEEEATVTMGLEGKSGEEEHRREAAAPEEMMGERSRSPFPGRQSLVNKVHPHIRKFL